MLPVRLRTSLLNMQGEMMKIAATILTVIYIISSLALPVYSAGDCLRPLAARIAEQGQKNADIGFSQKYYASIRGLLDKITTANAYQSARKAFGLYEKFLQTAVELPAKRMDSQAAKITPEALNVMGNLASKAVSARDIRTWCSFLVNMPEIRSSWQKYGTPNIWQFLLRNKENPDIIKLREVYGVDIDLLPDEKLPDDKVGPLIESLESLSSFEGTDIVEFDSSQDYSDRRKTVLLEEALSLDKIIREIEALGSPDGARKVIEEIGKFFDQKKDHEICTFEPKNQIGFKGKLVLLRRNNRIYYKIVLIKDGFNRSFEARLMETLPYQMRYIPFYTDSALIDYRNNAELADDSLILQQLLDIANANKAGASCSYNPVGSIEIMVEPGKDGKKRYYVITGSSGLQFFHQGHLFTADETKEAITDALREMGINKSRIPSLTEKFFKEGKGLYKDELVAKGFSLDILRDATISVFPCSIISAIIKQPYCRRHKMNWLSKTPYRPRQTCPSRCAERGAKMAHLIARIISFDEGIPAIELIGGVDLNDGGILVKFRDIDTGEVKTGIVSQQRIQVESRKTITYEKVIDISSSTPLCIHCADFFRDFNKKFVSGENIYIYKYIRPYDYNKGAGDIESQRAQDMAAMDMVVQSGKMAYIQLPKLSPSQKNGEAMVLSRALLEGAVEEIEKALLSRKDNAYGLSTGMLPPSATKPVKEAVILLKPPVASNLATVEEVLRRAQDFGYEIAGLRVFNGRYFEKHPKAIAVLYQEAYSGYVSEKFSPSVMHGIRKIYDSSDFDFFFDEPFSEDMVIPGEHLKLRYSLSENDITELWKEARVDLSFDELKRRFLIDDVTVENNGIHLRKKGREIILPKDLLGDGGRSITWFRSGLCFGLNKVGHARNIFPVKDSRINNNKPVLVMNGYVPGLFSLFKREADTKTLAVVIRSTNSRSATWKMLRDGFLGDDNNPRGDNMAGSIRKDAVLDRLPLNIDPLDKNQLNGQKNIAHLSKGPLEGIAEMASLFGIETEETSFGKLLAESGYSMPYIKYLFNNPLVRIFNFKQGEYDSIGIFELTEKKEPLEALEIIKRYFPLVNEIEPDISATVDFDEFLSLQNKYKSGLLSVEKSSVPESDISPPRKKIISFENAVSRSGLNMIRFDREGMAMIKRGEIAEIIPGGGTSGRFYGYKSKIPESQRLKVIAPVWKIAGKVFSSIEVKMMHLKHLLKKANGGHIPLAIMGSGNNISYLEKKSRGYGIYPTEDLYFYAQGEIPRVNPTEKDIRDSGAPSDSKKYNLPYGKDADANVAQWLSDNGEMGDIFRDENGEFSGKPPGHFDIIAKLVLSRRLYELAERGVKVLHIANGDDIGAILDSAKAAYLKQEDDIDILTLLVEKNTVYSISKDDFTLEEKIRFRMRPVSNDGIEEFRVISRNGKIIKHNLPCGLEPRLQENKLVIIHEGKILKSGFSGKVEKGGTFIHVLSRGKDMVLDQLLAGKYFSANHFYIKVGAIMRLFDLDLETYARISQADLLKKVKRITSKMPMHIEIKPVNVRMNKTPDDGAGINMRPAAQFMRYLGEITGLEGINVEPILIDRDGSTNREGYCSTKDTTGISLNAPVLYSLLGLDAYGNPQSNSKLFFKKGDEKEAAKYQLLDDAKGGNDERPRVREIGTGHIYYLNTVRDEIMTERLFTRFANYLFGEESPNCDYKVLREGEFTIVNSSLYINIPVIGLSRAAQGYKGEELRKKSRSSRNKMIAIFTFLRSFDHSRAYDGSYHNLEKVGNNEFLSYDNLASLHYLYLNPKEQRGNRIGWWETALTKDKNKLDFSTIARYARKISMMTDKEVGAILSDSELPEETAHNYMEFLKKTRSSIFSDIEDIFRRRGITHNGKEIILQKYLFASEAGLSKMKITKKLSDTSVNSEFLKTDLSISQLINSSA